LFQLYELRSCRETVQTYKDYVERDVEQDSLEKANYARALELERKAVDLMRQERDLEKDRADLYEQLYKGIKKGPGFGCWMKRIFTLGIARCR